MNERRLALRLNWRQVADAAGISYEALRAIRRGDYRPAELTARSLDEALQWRPGSVYAVLDGGEPTTANHATAEPQPDSPPGGSTSSSPSDRLSSRELETLAEMVASAAHGFDLTPEQVNMAYLRAQQIIEERRRRSAEGGDDREDPPRRHRAS